LLPFATPESRLRLHSETWLRPDRLDATVADIAV